VDDLTRGVERATADGWHFDLPFAQTRDGGATGRRERAAVLLSRPRAGAAGATTTVTIERRASFGLLGDRLLGAAAYWDEYLVAAVDDDRRQAWGTPVTLGDGAARCGRLGFNFRVDAPGDLTWSITGLRAKPAATGAGFTCSDQRLGGR
jgi:hypothetical protein